MISNPEDLQSNLSKLIENADAFSSELLEELRFLRQALQRLANIEHDLRKQTTFLQQLIDLIPMGIAVHINGIIAMVNPTGVSLLQAQSEDELIGQKAIELVHPDFRQKALERIQRLLQDVPASDFPIVPFVEEKFLTINGDAFDAEVAGIVMSPTEEGTPILVLFRDITQQKQQRQALEASEARFRQLVSLMPDGVIIHKNRRIIFANDAAVQMLQVECAEDLIGREISEFLLPNERCLVEKRIRELLDSWEALPISKNHIIRPDGSIFLAEIRAFPFKDQEERAILVVIQDITERERMLAELEKSEAKFRLLAELLPASVFIIAENGELLYMNQSSKTVLGYSVEETMSLDFANIIDRETLSVGEKYFLALEIGETTRYELKVLSKWGDWRWLDVWITKTVLDDRLVGLGVALDVTWRKEMEQALKEHAQHLVTALEEERRRIASELHDEVGQQLIGMKFALENAQRHAKTPQTQRAIQDARQQLGALTEQVRELSLSFRPPMLDDLGLLPTLLWYFKRYTERTGIQVHFNQYGLNGLDIPQAHTLTAYRVIQEALTNIAKHANTDEVSVEFKVTRTRMKITIRDNGVGFDPNEVFQHYRSSGLQGMKERVTILSGKFDIQSAPQQGATISVSIPLPSK